MKSSEQRFRTAFFGFNREDVQGYILRADRAHREKLQQLEEELSAARKEQDGLREELRQSGELAAEEARVRASLEESTESLTQVRGELAQAEEQLAAARSELERLQSQVAELEPAAKSYEQLKERVARIELEAHEKAQQTMDSAQAGAEEVRKDTRAWLAVMLEGYDELRSASDALDKRLQSFGSAAEKLRESEATADRLREELRR